MTALSPGLVITQNLRLVQPLGEGGMASVWIADHAALRTQVVVKFLADEHAASPDIVARFSREAAAASSVRSPHVVQILDHGVAANGLPYIAMELLDGEDLMKRLARDKKLPPSVVSDVVVQVCRALSRAHERGVIHRDIKPANIFLTDAGSGELFVKVLDFGMAKSIQQDPTVGTRPGVLLGTPHYMSPEQVLGKTNMDHRVDLWALGVVVFEALTGRTPFLGDNFGALALAICNGPIPKPSDVDPSVPPSIDAWFEKACARDPNMRFSTAKELADAFVAAVANPGARPFSAETSGQFDDTQLAMPLADSGSHPSLQALQSGAIPILVPNVPVPVLPARPAPAARKPTTALIAAMIALGLFMALGAGSLLYVLLR